MPLEILAEERAGVPLHAERTDQLEPLEPGLLEQLAALGTRARPAPRPPSSR